MKAARRITSPFLRCVPWRSPPARTSFPTSTRARRCRSWSATRSAPASTSTPALSRRICSRHIPGNPGVIVQNMVGASGIMAANWLANVAPKDGTVMATFVHTVPFEPVFGNAKAQYDPAKLAWIGNMEASTGLCGVTKASGITRSTKSWPGKRSSAPPAPPARSAPTRRRSATWPAPSSRWCTATRAPPRSSSP